jgi:death-on-curing protein
MRYLTLDEVLEIHRLLIEQSGGSHGVRDAGLLQSAVNQPAMTFASKISIQASPTRLPRFVFR